MSDEIVIPRSVTCCGFAGDKGFTFPELNASALSGLKEEVKDYVCGISNSRTREDRFKLSFWINLLLCI
ncbi:MAG: hypothetical protein AB8U95_05230 [Francisella endosymbiont of Hyalomma asiaticum]